MKVYFHYYFTRIFGISFFSVFFWGFSGVYTQDLSLIKDSRCYEFKKNFFSLNNQCFPFEYEDVFEESFSALKKEELEVELENFEYGSELFFEEWKKQTSSEIIQGNNENLLEKEHKDDMVHKNDMVNNETLLYDFEEKKDQIEKDNNDTEENKDHVSEKEDILEKVKFYDYLSESLKERFNYASIDCAANVLRANVEAKGISSILSSDNDFYMLNKCSAVNKFVIVELCNDILIDTIVLGNLEFFSSTFKDFRVSISDRYPIRETQWKELGIFTAMNIKDVQTFTISNPLIWSKYLRIDFLTHYGDEFYCPVTLLRVHGTTMIDELKYEESELKENVKFNDKAIFKTQDLKQSSNDLSNFDEHSTQNQKIDFDTEKTHKTSFLPTEHFVNASIVADLYDNILLQDINHYTDSDSSYFSSRSKSPFLNGNHYWIPAFFIKNPVCSCLDNFSSSTFYSNFTEKNAINNQTTQNTTQSPSSNVENLGMQKNIYKTISKRLSFLEMNASLYLQYIEQQSKILRNIFIKMEKKQDNKIDFITQTLNSTLFSRLNSLKHQYEELWQNILSKIEYERDKSKKDVDMVASKLEYLSNEILIQRWIIVFQFLILFTVFIFIFRFS
ncbi:hypothetical protein T552_00242 [Pneumocystis carinii B80]|uniref:SUN-like protein 1 n=1 Tax=Pneumocystis carinii (strain B80) TaxID=1408658 RepID=A0A0W4ZTC4_PNEC8|nr:hypothetical protein T552_00242 [Pneumocystis carinii B80]KTW31604.1 hypothetical protein T552_00242 [Pneumocystis carinii B80]